METEISSLHLPDITMNYRILIDFIEGKPFFTVHEVFTDSAGYLINYDNGPATVQGVDLTEVKMVLARMVFCINKPILYAGKRFPEEYKPE